MAKKEFRINEHIVLKLEFKKTNIYIENRLFRQCKYLFINIPQDNDRQLEVTSIDDAAETLSSKLEKDLRPRQIGMSSEQEFWGHCSNMQAWAENDYDTRLIHRSLAFPLLKELADRGDIIAKKRFEYEISTRFAEGSDQVRTYLMKEEYLDYLDVEELKVLQKGSTVDERTKKKLEFYIDRPEIFVYYHPENENTILGISYMTRKMYGEILYYGLLVYEGSMGFSKEFFKLTAKGNQFSEYIYNVNLANFERDAFTRQIPEASWYRQGEDGFKNIHFSHINELEMEYLFRIRRVLSRFYHNPTYYMQLKEKKISLFEHILNSEDKTRLSYKSTQFNTKILEFIPRAIVEAQDIEELVKL